MTKGSGLRKYDYVCPLLQSTNDHVTRARKSFLWFRAFNQVTSTFLLSDSVIFCWKIQLALVILVRPIARRL